MQWPSSVVYAKPPLRLSLDDAIAVAVRDNPNVQSKHLNYLSQKLNLYVEHWQFYPHYGLEGTAGSYRKVLSGVPAPTNQNYTITPSVSLTTPIGTKISLSSTNPQTDHFNPALSLEVSQPLLRGFGPAVVEAALFNARDSLQVAKLNIEDILRTTITSVINAYLDIMSAQRKITIDEDALRRAEQSVEQTKLFIKAGRKAGNELVTVSANVASAKTQLENDRNSLTQDRYALLTAIGIDPNANIDFEKFEIAKLIAKYHLPKLIDVKSQVLSSDIQYQIDQITLHGSISRALLVEEDNARWKLDLTANVVSGNGIGGGRNAGLNSVLNGTNVVQKFGLQFTIPIDDQASKQYIANAKMALQQAELALLQTKWAKETGAINAWNLVGSTQRALHYAEDAEKLQEKTYHISNQKYLHGLIDSLEWQSAQVQLIQSQQTLLNAQISYLKALVNLDSLMGHTLQTWQVKVRY